MARVRRGKSSRVEREHDRTHLGGVDLLERLEDVLDAGLDGLGGEGRRGVGALLDEERGGEPDRGERGGREGGAADDGGDERAGGGAEHGLLGGECLVRESEEEAEAGRRIRGDSGGSSPASTALVRTEGQIRLVQPSDTESMRRANTPTPAPDARAAAELLRSGAALSSLSVSSSPCTELTRLFRAAFQVEIDAIHRAAPGAPKGEVYKPPAGAGGASGAWGAAAASQPKCASLDALLSVTTRSS